MKVFFLIDTPLAGEIALSLAGHFSRAGTECNVVAFLMRPAYFRQKFPHVISKLGTVPNITLASEEDYPGSGRVKILRTIKADIYVTIDDADPLEADFLLAAKHLGLPTLLIQPGIIGHYPFTWRNLKLVLNLFTRFSGILTEYRRIWQTLGETGRSLPGRCNFVIGHLTMRFRRKSVFSGACDVIAVSGDYNKQLCVKQGFPPHKVVVTGLPRLDSIDKPSQDTDEFTKQVEQLRTDMKIALYLPSLAAEHKMQSYKVQMETTRQVISSVRDMQGVRLVIKPHPGENPQSYRSVVNELASNALVYAGSNLHDLIRTSDVVVTGISGTGLETLALDKTLVIINLATGGGYFPPGYEYIPYISSGIAFGVQSLEELPSVINAALHDEAEIAKRRSMSAEFVYHHLYKLDGLASKRVADLILEMVAARKATVGN